MNQSLAELLWDLRDEQVVDIWDRDHEINIFSGPLEQLPYVYIREYLWSDTDVLNTTWRDDGSVEIVIDEEGE